MEAFNILRNPAPAVVPKKKKSMKENVTTANEILENLFSQLDELEMSVLKKTTAIEKKYIGLETLINDYAVIFDKYKSEKLRKRKGFPVMKKIKSTIREFHNNIIPSETHLFYCLITETELLIAKYAETRAGLPRKMVKKLKAAEDDILLIERELEKLTRVISDDFKDCIMPSEDVKERSKDAINRMSGFSMRAVYHNDILYNYDNCQESLSKIIAAHTEDLEELVFKKLSRESQYSLDIQARIKAMRSLLSNKEIRYPVKLKSEAKGILTRLENLVTCIRNNISELSEQELESELGKYSEFIKISCEIEGINFSLDTKDVWESYLESLKHMTEVYLAKEMKWLKELAAKRRNVA